MEGWNVIFRLEPHETDALREGLVGVHPVEEWAIITELISGGEAEGDVDLWLTVDAPSGPEAEHEARQVYSRARLAAALPPAEPQIIGFLPPPTPQALDQALAEQAFTLLETGHEDFAVVRAQTACEVLVRDAFRDLLPRHEVPDDLADALGRGAALTTPTSRGVFAWLTGERVEQEPWWSSYREHVSRRNAIVHEAIEVTTNQATASIDACMEFRRYVARAWATAAQPDA